MQKSVVNFKAPPKRCKTHGVWIKVDTGATHMGMKEEKKRIALSREKA